MQPTLVITAPAEGMVYINGRFSGEVCPEKTLFAPVAPFGPVWLEFRPLTAEHLPMARRIVFSGGTPLADSMADDLFAICWPGNIVEIELAPRRMPSCAPELLTLDGTACRICRNETARLEIGGASVDLPRDAMPEQLIRSGGAIAVTGSAGGGRFLLALSADASRQTGLLRADRIDFEAPGILRTAEYSGDVAGHAVLSRWRLDGAGLARIASEDAWENGIPNRPSTAEETARAAVEAALLSRFDEAESYFLPGAPIALPLEEIPALGSLCLPMKYGQPGAAAVALLRLEEENLARATPLYYRAESYGGEWRLTGLRT